MPLTTVLQISVGREGQSDLTVIRASRFITVLGGMAKPLPFPIPNGAFQEFPFRHSEWGPIWYHTYQPRYLAHSTTHAWHTRHHRALRTYAVLRACESCMCTQLQLRQPKACGFSFPARCLVVAALLTRL